MKNAVRFVFSFLLVFIIILYYGCCIINGLFSSSRFLTEHAEKNNISSRICESLNGQFEAQYSKTAVPAEIYMNVITPEWVSNAIKQSINHYWLNNSETDFSVDYSALEKSLTEYFEQYAAEKNYPKDSAYEAKLADTIRNAENIIGNELDIYNFRTIRASGILNKLHGLKNTAHKLLLPLMICGLVCVVVLACLKKPLYWSGTSLFASGAIFTALAIVFPVMNSSEFADQLTGILVIDAMNDIKSTVMLSGAAMLGIGAVMLFISIIKSSDDDESDKTDEKTEK